MNAEINRIRQEFKQFIRSYGVIGVAIGIVMGQAAARLITACVENLVMPLIGVVLPGNKWQEAVIVIGRVNIKIGLVISAFIDFFVVSVVVFFFVRYIFKVEPEKERVRKDNDA